MTPAERAKLFWEISKEADRRFPKSLNCDERGFLERLLSEPKASKALELTVLKMSANRIANEMVCSKPNGSLPRLGISFFYTGVLAGS